jgi:adenylate cyclase class 2
MKGVPRRQLGRPESASDYLAEQPVWQHVPRNELKPLPYTKGVPGTISAKREIEIKLRVDRLEGMLRRLREIGAVPQGRVLERNTLFDTPHSAVRRHGRLLRLRQQTSAPGHGLRGQPNSAVLTSKAPPAPVSAKEMRRIYKEVQEREAPVKDATRLTQILKSLGFRPGFRYEKYRSSFRLRELHLDLDETPLGVYLELEGSPSAIDRTALAFGYGPKDYIRATYWSLYAAECRRRKVKPRNMLFTTQKSR